MVLPLLPVAVQPEAGDGLVRAAVGELRCARLGVVRVHGGRQMRPHMQREFYIYWLVAAAFTS